MTVSERILSRISKYVSRYLNTRAVFLMDMGLSFVASAAIVLGIFFFTDSAVRISSFSVAWILVSVFASAVSFAVLRSYRIVIRHSSVRDIARFIAASMLKEALLACIILICSNPFEWFFTPRILLLLLLCDFFMTTFCLIFVRVMMIVVYDIYSSKLRQEKNIKRVLVYSSADKSVAMVTRLQKSPHYKVVGFMSFDAKKEDMTISDLPIYHFTDGQSVADLHQKIAFDAILFSSEADLQKERDTLVKYATQNFIQVLLAPGIDDVSNGVGLGPAIRELRIEDLLGREEISISLDEIKKIFNGRTIMVTGAAGSIGSELCRQLAGFGVGKLVLYDNAETPMHNLRLELEERFPGLDFVPIIGDVRLERRLDFAFRTHHPSVIFHAAAYKHVPLMEENPCEAVLVNVAGTRNVADKCIEYGVEKMVMISTDKAVNPTNIMGCTKRLAEIYVQSLGLAIESGEVKGETKFITTRFGNVLGSSGSVIPRFREQLAKGGPLTVTHPDINRFFMTIPEACRLVMEAATMVTENRICVFDMGNPVKIDTLARKMIELAGLKPDVDIKIEYTGLRPGEKLYEEVLSNVENTDPTSHDRIRIARVRSYDYRYASEVVDRLEELSRAVNIPDTVQLMKKTVPEFVSNNSRFSEFDAKN